MPYIAQKQRVGMKELVDEVIKEIETRVSSGWYSEKDVCGNITYVIFKLIKHFYAEGRWYDKKDAEKACLSAIDEFNRRFLHPYEDKKIEQNGDV